MAVAPLDGPLVPPARVRGISLVRRIYGPRAVGLGLGSIGVGAGLAQSDASAWLWAVLLINGFLWPHVAYGWALQSAVPHEAEHRNLLVDSLCGGFWVPAMAFNALPSMLIIAMLSMDNIAVGGWRLFLKGLAAHWIGAAAAVSILGFSFEPASSLATILACAPFMIVYPVVIGAVTHQLASQLTRQKNELRGLHERDYLSGLCSRPYWQGRLEEEFTRSRRHRRAASLLVIDIDHFKKINDKFGHAAGDDVITHLGRILQGGLRRMDIAGRIGGEEFAALLPETDAEQALAVAERFRLAVKDTRLPAWPALQATVSVGIAQLSGRETSSREWLAHADRALYQAKNAGRDTVRVHVPSNDRAALESRPVL
ncbi:MAG TPA: diguanylate cyclase [Burkholderiaceae bacterium]|nr:diguanylate cyclase [Burkholderiaceae bacterium]